MEKVFNEDMVSLILPVYNISKEFLEKSIYSICNQTYKNIEIILIDDGSTNDSLKVCTEIAKSDQRIKVIHQENSGVSIARNKGIDFSKGEYICFIDPDDWIEPTYVEKLLLAIKKHNSDIAICNCTVHYCNHDELNSFTNIKLDYGNSISLRKEQIEDIQKQLIGKKICRYYPPEVAAGVPWGKMFKTSFIIENNLRFIPKLVRMQDNVFCLYAYENTSNMCYLNESLYVYRKERGSACYKYSPNIVEYFERYFEETILFLNKYEKEEILFKAFYMKELTSFNSYFTQLFFNKNYNKKFSVIREELNSLLSKDIYLDAFNNIDYNLLNFSEKIFVYLLKNKQYYILKILVKIRSLRKM